MLKDASVSLAGARTRATELSDSKPLNISPVLKVMHEIKEQFKKFLIILMIGMRESLN